MNQGGPVLTAPRLVSVTFADDSNIAQLDDLIARLGGSVWWKVLAEYGVGPVASTASIHVSATAPRVTDDGMIASWLAGQIASDPTDFGTPTGAI